MMDRKDYERVAGASASILSIIAALSGYLLVSAPLLVLGFLAYKRNAPKKANARVVDNDLGNFIDVLLREYTATGNLMQSLRTAALGKYTFSKEADIAIDRYSSGTDAQSAFSQLASEHAELAELSRLIESGLTNGTPITGQLRDLKARLKERHRHFLRNAGAVENALSINRLGSAVFFPLFAGVSINIIKFSDMVTTDASGASLSAIAAILACYIIISNYLNPKYGAKTSRLQLFEKTMVFSALGVLLFQVATVLMVNF